MHAHTLELLKDVLKDGAAVLDVGSGSGYLTACMAYMSIPTGYAVGIDCVPELTIQAPENIKNDNQELATTLQCVHGERGWTQWVRGQSSI